ncbi:MAG: hypothetical protein COA44_12025 [Arcobacter sp.]|nr:MAG: hypothetical protein COA44_12025 [Arcobacter sp.]
MLIGLNVQARDISSFINDFKAKKYNKVCDKGSRVYYGGYTDENFVSLVGISCAKVDRINILGMFQRSLVLSESSRENSSYFSTLILQKRLIYQFMIDDLDLSYLKLPSSSHLLSRVFEPLSNNKYQVLSRSPKLVEVHTDKRKYILSVSDDIPKKVLIDEYKTDGTLERHWYQ